MGFAAGFAAGLEAAYKKRLLEMKEQADEFARTVALQKLQMQQDELKNNAYKAFETLVNKTSDLAQKNIEMYNKISNDFRQKFIEAPDPTLRKMIVEDYNNKVKALNMKAQKMLQVATGLAKRLGVSDDLLQQYSTMVPLFPTIEVEETKDGKFVLNELSPDGQVVNRYETDWDKIRNVYSSNTSATGTSEYERELQKLLSSGAITKDEYYDLLKKRVTKLSQPGMASFYKDIETYRDIAGEKARETGVDIDQFANVDIRKLPDWKKAELQDAAFAYIRAYKPKVSQKLIDRIVNIDIATKQLADAFDETVAMLQRGEDVNAVEKYYRDTIGKYLGMPLSQYEKLYRDSRFKGAINIIRHGLFGSALTKNEKQEFLEYIPSLYSTNKSIVIGIKSLVRDKLSELDAIRKTVGYKPFNLIYGDVYRNLVELNDLIDRAMKSGYKKREPVVNLTQKYLGKEESQTGQPQETGNNEPEWKKYLY